MKLKISIFSLAVAICFSTAMVVCAENETAKESDKAKVKTAESVKKGPVALAPEPNYEFKSAMDSAEVIHDFVLQNKGDETLIVKKVKTG